MEMTQNPLDKFKHSLEQQGFNSPMLTTWAPHVYISGRGSFEIHCGSNGAQYLFSFKNSHPKAC